MAATISASGTWTAVTFDATVTPKTGPNVRENQKLNLTAFNSGVSRGGSPNYPELDAFIQLMADNLGLANQSCRVLIHHLTSMTLQRGEPVAREFTP